MENEIMGAVITTELHGDTKIKVGVYHDRENPYRDQKTITCTHCLDITKLNNKNKLEEKIRQYVRSFNVQKSTEFIKEVYSRINLECDLNHKDVYFEIKKQSIKNNKRKWYQHMEFVDYIMYLIDPDDITESIYKSIFKSNPVFVGWLIKIVHEINPKIKGLILTNGTVTFNLVTKKKNS